MRFCCKTRVSTLCGTGRQDASVISRNTREAPELQSAIESAYRAFAPHRVGRGLDFGSRVGTTQAAHEAMLKVLTQTPLRALPIEAIDAYFDYIFSAHFDGEFNAGE